MVDVTQNFRLRLSSSELRELTQWPEAVIIDYQGILQDALSITQQVNEQEGSIEASLAGLKGEVYSLVDQKDRRAEAVRKSQKRLEQIIYAW